MEFDKVIKERYAVRKFKNDNEKSKFNRIITVINGEEFNETFFVDGKMRLRLYKIF